MTNILDRVAENSARAQHKHFFPKTAQEFFALRLATRLDERAAAHHFAELAEEYSQGQLLLAYGRALASHVDLARRFHRELEPLKGKNGGSDGGIRLAAIRIERRAVAVAIFDGDHLKHADARQLSSSPDKALAASASFVSRMTRKFKFESVALETVPRGHEVQRTLLHQAVMQVLRAQAIGIVEVSKVDLLEAFSYPSTRFRQDLRKIISDIYPVLDETLGHPWTHDAAALGLYVQTERLFNNINQTVL